jgi:hypothetical protein
MVEYIIEIASADQVTNDCKESEEVYPSKYWETVTMGNTPEEVLELLLANANQENFSIENSWLRMVIIGNDGKVEIRTY